ncbi:MAG: hypothetical protein WBD24_07365 [Candidatus Omnitrophota bacterium]
MKGVMEAVSRGTPLYILPYKEHKVWGVGDIGEYWYGAEAGEKSSIARVGENTAPMSEVLAGAAEELLGKGAVERFGPKLPLVKILTPKGRLSVQFHDQKNELWIVTGIDRDLTGGEGRIILGFCPEAVEKYGSAITVYYHGALEEYGRALNDLVDILEEEGYKDLLLQKKSVISAAEEVRVSYVEEHLDGLKEAAGKMESFYNWRTVRTGDVIPIPAGTLHALGSGIEVVEPQIPGPTQSMEDGATYPIRYYFPGRKREGGKKELDIDRANEINSEVVEEEAPEVIEKTDLLKIERLPGGFESKGLEVHRITLAEGAELDAASIQSFHNLVVVKGKAHIIVQKEDFDIPKAHPGGEMMIVPASAGSYRIKAKEQGTQIIDTFTPLES